MDIYSELKRFNKEFWKSFRNGIILILLILIFTEVVKSVFKNHNQTLNQRPILKTKMFFYDVNSDKYIDDIIIENYQIINNQSLYNSEVLIDIKNSFPNLQSIPFIDKCHNLFDLLKVLNFHGEHQTEFQIISYYVNKYIPFEVSKEYGRERTLDLVNYLEKTYVEKVYQNFELKNYYEAKWLADMAFRRLRTLDTKPLDNLYEADWKRINKINLISIVLRYPELAYVYHNEINIFLNCVLSDFEIDISIVKNIKNLPVELETIKNYLLSVYMFRKKDYDSSLLLLSNSLQNENNFYLYHDALLLKARTLFWIFDGSRTDSTYKILIDETQEIRNKMRINSYITDLNHYLSFADTLHNPNLRISNNEIHNTKNTDTLLSNADIPLDNSFLQTFTKMDPIEMKVCIELLTLFYNERKNSSNK